MNPNEKPIAITRGNEIQIEKIIKKIGDKLKELKGLRDFVSEELDMREELLSAELSKSVDKLNVDLLASLSEEIEQLKEIFDQILTSEINGCNLISNLHNHELEIMEATEIIEEINACREEINQIKKK